MNKLEKTLRKLPASPGVYIMKGKKGKVIYVGKAKALRNRVRSYFQSADKLDIKTRNLVSAVEDIDYISTDSEVEALILECNMIKEYRPKYNVRLKDDKKYPFLKLTLYESFPRLCLVRKVANDGGEYFGPYTDVRALRRTMALIKSIFPLRDCPQPNFTVRAERECLNFQIGRCLGPCTGRIGEKEYMQLIDQVRLFLKGRNDSLKHSLERKMVSLSRKKRYEDAALVRDQLIAIDKVTEKQNVVDPGGKDEDIVSLAMEGDDGCAVVMRIREGRILSSESLMISPVDELERRDVLSSFLRLYYHSATDIPPGIYIDETPEDHETLERWLRSRTGRKVSVRVPRKGTRKALLRLAGRNAAMKLLEGGRIEADMLQILAEMKSELGLSRSPARIEVFDISNIQGSEAVGSLVTFVNGCPVKSEYRHFRIREVRGADDFAMMREVVSRRMRSVAEGKSRKPDMIMVDGGKGQISAAQKGMREAGVTGVPVIGLAKRNEEIFTGPRAAPVRLPARSGVLRYLQRMRDEAHRFAVEYHRKLRKKRTVSSELDKVPGIGEKLKIRLLVEFGSVGRLRRCSIEELATVPGVGEKIAEKVHRALRRE